MRNYKRETIPPSAELTPPFAQGRHGAEMQEIASAQVLMEDKKTLDEWRAEIEARMAEIEAKLKVENTAEENQ